MKIDSVMFSSPDRRWSIITTSNILKYFKRKDHNVKINTSDSRDSSYMKNTWLPGGIMTAVWGKYSNFIERDSFYNNELGRWNSYQLSNGTKFILIIGFYRMPISSSKGIHTNKV